MNKLSNTIYDHYVSHFDEMPFDYRFHFASRLYQWSDDADMLAKLGDLKAEFTLNNPAASVQFVVDRFKNAPLDGVRNAAERRRPYFEKYPLLRSAGAVLFRLTFLKNIYGIDARELFYQHFNQDDVEQMAADLQADTEALAVLSTHAINFLYLYERVIKESDTSLNPAQFLHVGKTSYNLDDRGDIQLLIYLYTHCIIGESQFYNRALPAIHLPVYQAMLDELETIISERYDEINLDNKFEYLVAVQLAKHRTQLANRIWDEATRSLSPNGQYIIDVHNNNPQPDKIGLAESEHRNVLCIMSSIVSQKLS